MAEEMGVGAHLAYSCFRSTATITAQLDTAFLVAALIFLFFYFFLLT